MSGTVRTASDIAGLYHQRLGALGPDFERMREVREVYNGDVVLPLPELAKDERSSVANLTQQGLDSFAMRIASVLPTMDWPVLKPGIKDSRQKAADRKQVVHGWWEFSKLQKVASRRARWLLGYGAAPVVVRPDPEIGCPRWDPVNPMDVFPSPVHLDCYTPHDAIIRHKRDYHWLMHRYPEALLSVRKGPQAEKQNQQFEVLEYIDHEDVVFVLLGHDKGGKEGWTQDAAWNEAELIRRPNRAGICWAVTPSRITLDRPMGHFDSILGMYKTQAALMALEVIATRKAIYPTPWVVNTQNGAQPNIIQLPDAVNGEPGVITNGTLIHQQLDPSLRGSTVRQDLEMAARQTAGIPAEFGGSSQPNVRTARRGAQIMGAATDFTVAAAQDIFAEALHDENERAVAIDKGYYNYSKSFYVSTKGARGMVNYKPKDTFEPLAQHIVKYPAVGYDINDLVINGGQRIAQETLSKLGFMKIDPMVDDPEAMDSEIKLEKAEAAFFASFQEQQAAPDAPWRMEHVAEFAQRLAKGEKWYEAVGAIQEKLQQQQAEGAEPGSPEAMPGMNPEMTPGGIPTVGEPQPSLQNMNQMLGQLAGVGQSLKYR